MIVFNDSHFSTILLPRERKMIIDELQKIPQKLQVLLSNEVVAGNKILRAFVSQGSADILMELPFLFEYRGRGISFDLSSDLHQSGEFYFVTDETDYVVCAPLQKSPITRLTNDLDDY